MRANIASIFAQVVRLNKSNNFVDSLGVSPKIREIHEIRGTEIYSHGFLETFMLGSCRLIFQRSHF